LFYHGEALDDGSIPVNDLAPSLLAFSELIQEINYYITQNKADVTLKIKHGFQKGSFGIDLIIDFTRNFIDYFVNIFSNDSSVAIVNFLAMIGIPGGIGIFHIIQQSKGKNPKTILEIGDKVKLEFDGGYIEIDKNTYNLYNNVIARRAIASIVKPLLTEGIEEMSFQYENKKTIHIQKNEANSFIKIPELDTNIKNDQIESITECLLKPETIHFKIGKLWRFNDGGKSNFYSISDADFLEKINNNMVKLGASDSLLVKVKTNQWHDEKGRLNTDREILKIIKIIEPKTQTKLF
jgi:hypothetical protein